MRNQYYYFVTGLPTLNIDDNKVQINTSDFLIQAQQHLSAGDFRLLTLLCLPEDADLLLRIIYGKVNENVPPEECSLSFWQNYVELMKRKAADPGVSLPKDYRAYPDVFHTTVLEIFQAEEMPSYLDSQHKILDIVYDYCSNLQNEFLKHWFEFNRDIRNILTAINGREHKIPFAKYLVGTGDLVSRLAQSHATDFGLGKEHELFESVYRIWEQNNILYRERGYDLLRWKWIDSQNFFNYFNIDRILGYYAQLRILERWQGMEPTLGKEVFRDTMDNLVNSFEFPEQFNIKSIIKK